jgi:DNA-binding XRE family transcriptional regulator
MNVKVDGHLVKALRIKHSYSQEKLAEIVGVNLRTIQRIETTGVASLGTRGALAKAFAVRPDELDLSDVHAVASAGASLPVLPRWPVLLLSAVLVVIGWVVVAASIMGATPSPKGLVVAQLIGGTAIALIGFFVLARLTPLPRWRSYSVLAIWVVTIATTPPVLILNALVAIGLWAAFEFGILMTRFSAGPTTRLRNP